MMNKIKKLFGGVNMSWPKIAIFAVVTAVYTALINQVPFLNNTSFQDIAVNPECWLLFAVFIVANCGKWWEASLKCFVFFLISQPLIYLIEVPFVSDGWGIFRYYKWWFIITVLTLPGAVVAFLIKRKDWLSAAVITVANGLAAYMASTYFFSVQKNFPQHILSLVFCIALGFFFAVVLFDDKKKIIAVCAVFAAMLIGLIAFNYARNSVTVTEYLELGEGEWSYTVDNEDIVDVVITDGKAEIKSEKNGYTIICFTDSDGHKAEYGVLVDGKNLSLSPVD